MNSPGFWGVEGEFGARHPGCVARSRYDFGGATAAKGRTGKSCQSSELWLCAYVKDEDTL